MNRPEEQRYVEALKKASAKIKELLRENETLKRSGPIAVIGLGCRFPGGAGSPDQFWNLLTNGVDAVAEIPAARWAANQYYDSDPAAPGKMYTRSGPFSSEVAGFDAAFF